MYPLAAAYSQSALIPISMAVDRIGAKSLHDQGITGKGIKIAVLDTGASLSHPMIKPNIIRAESMVAGESPEDEFGHGSWVASALVGVPTNSPQGLLYGVAPGASLIVIKVLGNNGMGSMQQIVAGMERAAELEADIVSMSLGSLFGTNLTPDSRTLNELAAKNGILFVCANGNSFAPLTVGSPAAAAMSIGVGAVAMQVPGDGSPSTFASKGPTLDGLPKPNISTYGGNVVSEKGAELLYAADKHGGFTGEAGTSMATPITAGSLALLLSAGVKRDRAVMEELFARSGNGIYNTVTGWGLLNVPKMLEVWKSGGGVPFLSVLGTIPYQALSPIYQLVPRPQPETIRLQVIR